MLRAERVGRFDRQVAGTASRISTRMRLTASHSPQPMPMRIRVGIVRASSGRPLSKKSEAAAASARAFSSRLLSGCRQRDALAMADEERDAELILELLDVPAQRWLRDVQPLGGLGHAGFFGDGDERAQVAEIHGRRILYQIRMARGSKMYWTELRRKAQGNAVNSPRRAAFSRYWCQPP